MQSRLPVDLKQLYDDHSKKYKEVKQGIIYMEELIQEGKEIGSQKPYCGWSTLPRLCIELNESALAIKKVMAAIPQDKVLDKEESMLLALSELCVSDANYAEQLFRRYTTNFNLLQPTIFKVLSQFTTSKAQLEDSFAQIANESVAEMKKTTLDVKKQEEVFLKEFDDLKTMHEIYKLSGDPTVFKEMQTFAQKLKNEINEFFFKINLYDIRMAFESQQNIMAIQSHLDVMMIKEKHSSRINIQKLLIESIEKTLAPKNMTETIDAHSNEVRLSSRKFLDSEPVRHMLMTNGGVKLEAAVSPPQKKSK